MSTATLSRTEIKSAKKSLARHRVNKTYIQMEAAKNGGLTPNQKVALGTLGVKNAIQRINNKALSTDNQLKVADCAKLTKLMADFNKAVTAILKANA
jgi:hypothetical protein